MKALPDHRHHPPRAAAGLRGGVRPSRTTRATEAWLGKTLRVPLFGQEVPVLADPAADPGKGTGAVMCCTFGDATDVAWRRTHELPLIQAIDGGGRMTAVAGEYAGLTDRAKPASRSRMTC